MQETIAKLTSKDDKYACAIAEKIISESQDTDKWYEFFDDFAPLLNHPKSLVRNRVLYILAANAQWDDENRFDAILNDYLAHVIDEKPITARQCIKALAQVGKAKPQINQDAVRLMKQLYGIDMEQTQYSKTFDKIPSPDIAISMGCDVGCPYIGRNFDDNWGLPDPTGKSDDEFISVIKSIEKKITEL